jgi:hypothetical protein
LKALEANAAELLLCSIGHPRANPAKVPRGTSPALAAWFRLAMLPTLQGAKEIIMKLAKLSVLSTAALLAGGISLAMAQSNPAPSPSGPAGAASTNQGKCWDSASNQIKDMAGAPRSPGGVTTGAASSGSAANSQSKPGAMGAQNRPAAAAGLPNC